MEYENWVFVENMGYSLGNFPRVKLLVCGGQSWVVSVLLA